MPIIMCEVCDYFGVGRTAEDRLADVIAHEVREHSRYEDKSWLMEKEIEEMEDDIKQYH